MAPRKDSKVIVGVDFGTTKGWRFSGVSWASDTSKAPRVIVDWPNPAATNANSEKVPSAISYDVTGKVKNWGYEVTETENSFRWFKIMLEEAPQARPEYAKAIEKIRGDNQSLLEETHKTLEDVVVDYLRALWDYTREDIRKRIDNKSWEKTALVVLTVPAVWSDSAKEKTREAAKKAGMGSNIRLVFEPEAAAVATLKERAADQVLEVGNSFVVCDAGGGTVDLISYNIRNIDPFEVIECAIGDGDLCGSVYLDQAFERFVKAKIGNDQYDTMKTPARRSLRQKFDNGIKRAFEWQSSKSYFIEVYGVADNEKEGIADGYLTLTPSALSTIFDTICGKIDPLVQRQMDLAKGKGHNITAILLVGGFGESRYLHGRLEATFSWQGGPQGLGVMQVDRAWSAVCRGATIWGQAISLRESQASAMVRPVVTSKLARGSYGFVLLEPYDERRHNLRDRVLEELSGDFKVQSMVWVVRKGQYIIEGAPPVRYNVLRRIEKPRWGTRKKKDFSLQLYYCTGNVPPPRPDSSISRLCNVGYSVSEHKLRTAGTKCHAGTKGKNHYICDFVIEINMDTARLEFSVQFRGKDVGSVDTEYIQQKG